MEIASQIEAEGKAWAAASDSFGWHGPVNDRKVAENAQRHREDKYAADRAQEDERRRRARVRRLEKKYKLSPIFQARCKLGNLGRRVKSWVKSTLNKGALATLSNVILSPGIGTHDAAVRGYTQSLIAIAEASTLVADQDPHDDRVGTQGLTHTPTHLSHSPSGDLSRLPSEIRQQIYSYVVYDYAEMIHILDGAALGISDRTLFSTPCITPSDQVLLDRGLFSKSTWGKGPLSRYHLYCDLYATPPSMLHAEAVSLEQYHGPLGGSRQACDVVVKARNQFKGRAPLMTLLLTCSQMYTESMEVIFQSLCMSFVGTRPLSLFLDTIDTGSMTRLRCLHITWPSWWRSHTVAWSINMRTHHDCTYWPPPDSDSSVALASWTNLWNDIAAIGTLNCIHVTIFQVPDGRGYHVFFQNEDLLAPLKHIKARKFVVELYGSDERVRERTLDIPFELHYHPNLGYDDWGPRTRPVTDHPSDFWGCHRVELMYGRDQKDICDRECHCDVIR